MRRDSVDNPVAVGYGRRGPGEQDDPSLTIAAQREAIEAYARFRGFELQEFFSDAAVSGAVPIEARRGGVALTKWLERPHPGGVVLLASRLERLFASATECVAYLGPWEQSGITLHVLDLGGAAVDLASPVGPLVRAVLSAAKDMEREQQQRPSLVGLRKPAGKPRLGEKVVRGFVVPDPDERFAVERIRALASEGKSLRLIAEALDQEGIPTKRRAKGWSKEAIRLILQRVERGDIRHLRPD